MDSILTFNSSYVHSSLKNVSSFGNVSLFQMQFLPCTDGQKCDFRDFLLNPSIQKFVCVIGHLYFCVFYDYHILSVSTAFYQIIYIDTALVIKAQPPENNRRLTPQHMMTSSNGNIFRVTGQFCGEFPGQGWIPTQRPVAWSFDVFFDLCMNIRLSNQSWG